jgi:hypothetical protein
MARTSKHKFKNCKGQGHNRACEVAVAIERMDDIKSANVYQKVKPTAEDEAATCP